MSQNYVGEIRMFGGNFAPRGWMFCNGQLLPIAQYDVLFSLIGTTYGGNGTSNFALPNLQSRIPVGQGQAPGLSNYVLGQAAGSEEVAIMVATMPAHSHLVTATTTSSSPNVSGLVPGQPATGQHFYAAPMQGQPDPTPVQLSGSALMSQGSGLPHNNVMPFTAVNYIIAFTGIYPSRN